MLEFFLKTVAVILLVYILWIITGGVERGEERHERGEGGLFVEIRGTALDATSTDVFLPSIGENR
jgi:hypothetical protein